MFSGSSGSGSSNGSKGGEWRNKVYFDPEADESRGDSYWISDSELRQQLTDLIDTDEKIEKIWIYSHRLSDWQVCEGLLYHAYIVLETNLWFWSIEKNREGITIQRCKYKNYVKDKYRRIDRLQPISQRNYDQGRYRMKDLIDWLYENDELNNEYRYDQQHRNCQGFARKVFNQFAREKMCDEFLTS